MTQATTRAQRGRVDAVLDYIWDHLDSDLCLATLADRCGLSPFHFHRLFRSAVGETPRRYVRRLRLDRAAARLSRTRASVSTVAFDAGYESHEAFTRAFASAFGLPPREFRARAPEAIDTKTRIAHLEEQTLAFVRHVGPYDRMSGAFERLLNWANGRPSVDTANVLGVYFDDQEQTAPWKTRSDAAVLVTGGVVDAHAEHGVVRLRDLPARDYAVCRHDGAYDVWHVRRSYDELYRRWIPARHRAPSDAPPFEQYALDDAGAIPSTTIYVPLRASNGG